MSEHLPECFMLPWEGSHVGSVPICICERLRACEQRVTDAAILVGRRREWINQDREIAEAHEQGYAEALDRARDAVAALTPMRTLTGVRTFSQREALAAIDALKEKP